MAKIRLKELREEKGLLQRQVAKEIGVSYKTIGGYERGEREPDIDTIEKLCKFFDVSADYFLGFKDL